MLTVGVEEEFFVVDPATLCPAPVGLAEIEHLNQISINNAGVRAFDYEFQAPIIESRTGICTHLADLRTDLMRLRRLIIDAAGGEGLAVAAAGTLPTAEWRSTAITDKPRYQRIAEHYGDVVLRRLTCGYHVHVGVEDPDRAVRIANQVQPWLSVLLALSASSPFFGGRRTGYASYRHTLWGGFPVAGPTPYFGGFQEYTEHIDRLISSGIILDAGHLYWDVRLGTRFPTVEFRIADANPDIEMMILQAGLCRALVLTYFNESSESRSDLAMLRAASWHAARWGLDKDLIDPFSGDSVPAGQMATRLLSFVRDALEELNDFDYIVTLLKGVLSGGNAARRQLSLYTSTNSLEAVTEWLLIATRTSCEVTGQG